MPASVTTCSSPATPSTPPAPETLAYSLTLPAALQSPAIARTVTRTILRAHGLEDVTDAAGQVVSELASCACRFTPTTDVYVSLRYREAALRVLACVVRACGGDWGFGDAREPSGGTRMWTVVPREGARAYLRGAGAFER
ncbi:ATP-binding protein [Streptomyces sp. NPDC055506]